jgi:hypothetical protein
MNERWWNDERGAGNVHSKHSKGFYKLQLIGKVAFCRHEMALTHATQLSCYSYVHFLYGQGFEKIGGGDL